MKKLFFFFFLFAGMVCSAQNRLSFDYDAAGNQTSRNWCSNCHSKNASTPKDIAQVTENDLLQFFPNDVISYYPNPVKELLYLKWKNAEGVTITHIQLYNLNGQLIQEFKNLEDKSDFSISFYSLPQNLYSLNLVYTNGEQKSIKIIKE